MSAKRSGPFAAESSGSSSSESDSESDSGSDVDSLGGNTAEERAALIDDLEAKLHANPYLYAEHVAYVAALREEGELPRVRAARERFAQHFPLSEELWLDWIADEQSVLAGAEGDRRESALSLIRSLFERATADYLCPSVWVVFEQFEATHGQASEARAVCDRAITAVGQHVAEGVRVWDEARQLELVLLNEALEAGAADLALEQTRLVQRLFERQLAVPLLGMEATLAQYTHWCAEAGLAIADHVLVQYEAALARLAPCAPHEAALEAADVADRQPLYAAYIATILADPAVTPDRVELLYERAVADNALAGHVWLEYVLYLTENWLHVRLLDVHARSVRNCPWVAALWHEYIVSLERLLQPDDAYDAVFNSALAVGFQVADVAQLWQYRCDRALRRIDGSPATVAAWLDSMVACRESLASMATAAAGQQFDGGQAVVEAVNSATTESFLYQARVQAGRLRNMPAARETLDALYKTGHGGGYNVLTVVAALERAHGDHEHGAKAFRVAASKAREGAEYVYALWLQYEREEGSLADFEAAQAAIRKYGARVTQQLAQTYAKQSAVEASRDEKKLKQKREKQGAKRKHDNNQGGNGDGDGDGAPPAKRARRGAITADPETAALIARAAATTTTTDTDAATAPAAAASAVGGSKIVSKNFAIAGQDEEEIASRTVFLSNLTFLIDEEKVRALLQPCGPIKEVRVVVKERKKFAYVEFESRESVRAALDMDRTPIGGRPVFISQYSAARTSRPTAFKFSSDLDPRTLFVNNLHFETTAADLRELFAPFGIVKDVRLPTARNGSPSGRAYVEFENETAASTAVLQVDRRLVKGRQISVAISQPPKKAGGHTGADQEQPPQQSAYVAAAPSAATIAAFRPRAMLRHDKPRLQIGGKAAPARDPNAPVRQPAADAASAAVPAATGAGGLSNAQFANFFKK